MLYFMKGRKMAMKIDCDFSDTIEFHQAFLTNISWVTISNLCSQAAFVECSYCTTIVFCYINLSNLVWTKGFDTIIFLFSRSLRVWKMRIEWQFCTRDEVEGVNLSRDSQFFKRDDSVKMEIYSGKPWVQPICQIYITKRFFS